MAAAHPAGPLPLRSCPVMEALAKFTSVYGAEGFPSCSIFVVVFQIESFLGGKIFVFFFFCSMTPDNAHASTVAADGSFLGERC